jgi:YHS domain-containing protein
MYSKIIFASVILSLFSIVANAQDAMALRKKQFNLDEQVAINGYDPVAYFKLNAAVRGKKEIYLNHQGIVYRFSTVENREEFRKNPAHYEPEYGGWCAYAMGSKGEKVTVDPETFKIINGKLYLFYNSFFNNTLKSWNKDEQNLKSKADVNWKRIYH